jgi:hypothetical protein
VAQVALAQQLLHRDAGPVARQQRPGRGLGDVLGRDHRHRELGLDGVRQQARVLDLPERVVEVLEEGGRAQQQQVDAGDLLQPLFLRMQAGDHAGAFALVGAQAAECDDAAHAARAHGLGDGLAFLVLPRAVVGRAAIGGQQRVDGVGAAEGLRQKGRIAGVACQHLGAGAFERGQLVRVAAEGAHLGAGGQQPSGDLASGVAGGAHDGDGGEGVAHVRCSLGWDDMASTICGGDGLINA